jgi:hypothetical protein
MEQKQEGTSRRERSLEKAPICSSREFRWSRYSDRENLIPNLKLKRLDQRYVTLRYVQVFLIRAPTSSPVPTRHQLLAPGELHSRMDLCLVCKFSRSHYVSVPSRGTQLRRLHSTVRTATVIVMRLISGFPGSCIPFCKTARRSSEPRMVVLRVLV